MIRRWCHLALITIAPAVVIFTINPVPGYAISTAADCFDYGTYRGIVSEFNTTDHASDVALSGNYAYMATSWYGGLEVIDISVPGLPVLVAALDTLQGADGVDVSGDYAYVVGYPCDFQVVDISNPAAPFVAASIDTFSNSPDLYTFDVVVSGNYAYFANETSGLEVIDITTPTSPVAVGHVGWIQPHASCVAVSGSHAYVGDSWNGVNIIDISTPTAPALVGELPIMAGDIVVTGDYAYVTGTYLPYPYARGAAPGGAAATEGLEIYDVSTPTAPVLVGSVYLGPRMGLAISGDYALVGYEDGLEFVDVSDPAAPSLTATVAWWGGEVVSIATSGDNAYVLAEGYGLKVIDIGAAAVEPMLATVPAQRAMTSALSGGYAYVADWDAGLRIVDISSTDDPQIIRTVDTPGHAVDVKISAGYAYVADENAGFQIIDISDPNAAAIAGSAPTGINTKEAVIAGDYAYVIDKKTDGIDGLQVVDISNPASPSIVYTTDMPPNADQIALEDNYIYVVGNYLAAYDITTPDLPTFAGSDPTGGYDVTVSGNYAYVTGSPGLRIVDVSAPGSMTTVGSVSTPYGHIYAGSVTQSGGFAYVAGYDLFVVDVTTPESPVFVGTGAVWTCGAVTLWGDQIYASACDSGLWILKRHCGSPSDIAAGNVPGVISITNAPNPFNPSTKISYHVQRTGRVRLAIYSVDGKRVATLVDRHQNAGWYSITWDARNARGDVLSSGVYMAVIENEGLRQTRKMIHLK